MQAMGVGRAVGLRRLALVAFAAMALVGVGCGDDDGGGGGSTTKATADVQAAEKLIAPYVGQPSEFPITEPLAKRPPAGTKVAFLDIGTPVNALMWDLIQAPAKMMGVKLNRVRAGGDAEGINKAFDTILEQRPAAVIVSAVDPVLYQSQLEQLRKLDIPVVTSAITNGAEFGFDTVLFGQEDTKLTGELMAAWAVARSKGAVRNLVYFRVPELAFSTVAAEGAKETLGEICPECKLRVVDIPIAELGSTAPDRIVSDLQANPDTDYVLAGNDEMFAGLPAALKTASLDVPTIGSAPTPANLEAIKDGREDAALGLDLVYMMWASIDQVARELADQPLAGAQKGGEVVKQLLRKEDITFDPAFGWAGYDHAAKFAEVWGVEAPSK